MKNKALTVKLFATEMLAFIGPDFDHASSLMGLIMPVDRPKDHMGVNGSLQTIGVHIATLVVDHTAYDRKVKRPRLVLAIASSSFIEEALGSCECVLIHNVTMGCCYLKRLALEACEIVHCLNFGWLFSWDMKTPCCRSGCQTALTFFSSATRKR